MAETIKIEKKNSEGKLIVKEIPKDMLSLYLNIGWEKHVEKTNVSTKIEIGSKIKDEKNL